MFVPFRLWIMEIGALLPSFIFDEIEDEIQVPWPSMSLFPPIDGVCRARFNNDGVLENLASWEDIFNA